MNLAEYQNLALRTKVEYSKTEDQVLEGIFGLIGEVGEFTDHLKKHIFQKHDLNIEYLKEELGDILWYINLLCDATGVELKKRNISFYEDKLQQMKISLLRIDQAKGYISGHLADDLEEKEWFKPKFLDFPLLEIQYECCRLAYTIDVDIEDVAEANIQKLNKRYPEGFDPERSKNRGETA